MKISNKIGARFSFRTVDLIRVERDEIALKRYGMYIFFNFSKLLAQTGHIKLYEKKQEKIHVL